MSESGTASQEVASLPKPIALAIYAAMVRRERERRPAEAALVDEIDRLREEMQIVAAGLDLVISGGCDQATNLARLRDHLRREANA